MRDVKNLRDLEKVFSPYVVMYGPNEAKTGIRGVRSDAPDDAKEAFILWYRMNNRYPNGRMIPTNDQRLKRLIIDVGTSDDDPSDDGGVEHQSLIRRAYCIIA